jgi:O26-antigen biosynthesis N-acetyl-L-fucosamine transferase
MNFIILTDYYHPIVKSGSIIMGDLVNELSQQGHKITIVTFVENQSKACQIIFENGIQIIRIRSLTRDKKYGRVGRLWAERCYSNKIIKNLKKLQNIQCEAIICFSPSIFYGKAIKWLRKKYDSKVYLIIRDIFPKWTIDTGLLKEGLFYKYLKRVERDLYSSSDVIGIEAKSDLEYFENYGLNKSIKIEVLNNWGSPLGSIDDYLSSDNLLDSQKVNIVYGGNMGDAQDILSLVNSIDYSILGQRAILLLMGDGNQFDKVKNTINKKNLTNIVLVPTVDRKRYLSITSKADIGLVSLSKKMSSNNYPLKMLGYMQLAKPILASVNKNNEIIQMIVKKNIGLVSLASDAKSFNKNLDILINNEALRKEQGQNAFKLYKDQFTVEVSALQIYKHFL